jgi:hypothetical protein
MLAIWPNMLAMWANMLAIRPNILAIPRTMDAICLVQDIQCLVQGAIRALEETLVARVRLNPHLSTTTQPGTKPRRKLIGS